jgi:hypothetical protein
MSTRYLALLLLLVPAACGGDDDGGGGGGGADAAAESDASSSSAADATPGDPDAGCTADLYVAPDGDDDSGQGTEADPLRSIRLGVEEASGEACPNVVIHVAAGTYDDASGEVPFTIEREGITIAGAGSDTTVLTGVHEEQYLARLDHGAVVEGIHFAQPGGVTYQAIQLIGPARVSGILVTAPGGVGVVVSGEGAVIDESSVISDADSGVVVGSGAVLQMKDSTVTDVDNIGITFSDGAASNDPSRLDGVHVEDAGDDGVRITLNSRVIIRGSTIVGNGGSGVRVSGASVQVDLGTADEAGGNTFNVSANRNQGVGICNLTGLTLTASGNTWAECPPSDDANCTNGDDFNIGVSAANCTAQ